MSKDEKKKDKLFFPEWREERRFKIYFIVACFLILPTITKAVGEISGRNMAAARKKNKLKNFCAFKYFLFLFFYHFFA